MTPHLTSEEISGWIIGERTPEAQKHIAACDCCRREVDRLGYALGQFRESAWRWSEHWYDIRETRRTRAIWSWRWVAASGGLAVAAAIVGLLTHRPAAPSRHDEASFIQIPYVAPLAPYEQTTLVRLDVAITALKAAGFEVHAPEMAGGLTVDVLVGQDGRAHAIRPVDRSAAQ